MKSVVKTSYVFMKTTQLNHNYHILKTQLFPLPPLYTPEKCSDSKILKTLI